MTITKAIENQVKRHTTLFRIFPDGSSAYIIDGKKVSYEELKRLYPVQMFFNRKEENPDKRNQFLNDTN